MRAIFIALAVALAIAACSDTPTAPRMAGSESGLAAQLYCPGPFTMIAATKGDPIDNNADGAICEMIILAEDKVTLIASYVDNNVPIDQKACPPGFELRTSKIGEGEDRNADGWYCLATKENGTTVTIDNRFDVEKGGKVPPKSAEETP
jgi:hypothetical protein